MDKTIFSICVYDWREGAFGPTADIILPATEYELEDALHKVRGGEGGEAKVYVESCRGFPFLQSHICETEDLRALNALAEKLSTLEGWQVDALQGLVQMDEKNGTELNVSRLYDLASSVDSCQVLYDVKDYTSLGRFFAENDFIPELENVPDQAWDLLDFDAIGRRMAVQENGVFIDSGGYVVKIGDLKEKFKDLHLTPKKPDYTVLLDLGVMDAEESVLLKLPCSRSTLDAALNRLGVEDWSEISWRCADCLIPALRDAFSQTDSIDMANGAAARIAQISAEKILPLKALVEASQCSNLSDAIKLIDSMDAYTFTRQYDSPEAVALDKLSFLLGDGDRATLLPFVELHRYGKKLIEEQNISMTPYGIKVLWASEIEPFPMEVTKRRFPSMNHCGDITKLKGSELLPVDIICGGSPCQDLSVAGARAGLAGARSGLFMEQVRIVREMRAAEEMERGRIGLQIRPRYMVWENVPGAFSSGSPKGEDFRIVLEEIVRVRMPGAAVPMPYPNGWAPAGRLEIFGVMSLAWRILDAQYWGVAQRRKRIFLAADFAGNTAPKLLFDHLK